MSEDSFATTPEATGEVQAGVQERPVFNIDGVSYAIDGLPETVAILINDLLRFNQEQNELQYRLRIIQAAQQSYVAGIKQELAAQGVIPLESSDAQSTESA